MAIDYVARDFGDAASTDNTDNSTQPTTPAAPIDYVARDFPNVSTTPAQQAISYAKQIGRQVGLTGRDLVNGVGGLPLMAGDLINGGINSVTSGINNTTGTNIPKLHPFSQAVNNLMTQAGMPNPQNDSERFGNNIATGMAGVLGGNMLGSGLSALSTEATPVMKAIGNAFTSNPGTQVASAATGTSAAEIARENGASPKTQLAINLLGSTLPYAATSATPSILRNVIRGSDNGAGQQNMLNNINAFQKAGTTPTMGQATQSGITPWLEGVLAKLPGSSGIIANKATNQGQEIGNNFGQLSQDLSPNATGTKTGRMIQNAITAPTDADSAGGFISQFKNTASNLYDKFGNLLDPNTPINVNNTKSILTKNTTPIPGAENVSNYLISPQMRGMSSALTKDTNPLQPETPPVPYGYPTPLPAPPPPQQGVLPYNAVSNLRSMIGNKIADAPIISDIPTGQLKQLYGGLSQDMQNAAQQSTPNALQAFNRANNYYKAGMNRIEALNPIINQSTPENVFQQAIAGSKEGSTNINTVMRSVDQPTKQAITATVLKRMGQATPGNQNDAGDVFSNATFLTNWNKISPEAKQTLFGSHGQDFQDTMDNVAKVANNIKTGAKAYANPSGTSPGNAAIAAFVNLFSKPASVVGQVTGAKYLANKLTNPNMVNLAAQNSKGFNAGNFSPIAVNALQQQQ